MSTVSIIFRVRHVTLVVYSWIKLVTNNGSNHIVNGVMIFYRFSVSHGFQQTRHLSWETPIWKRSWSCINLNIGHCLHLRLGRINCTYLAPGKLSHKRNSIDHSIRCVWFRLWWPVRLFGSIYLVNYLTPKEVIGSNCWIRCGLFFGNPRTRNVTKLGYLHTVVHMCISWH